MKKKTLVLACLLAIALAVPVMADKMIFTQYGVSYGSMIAPSVLQSNSTGAYDTAVFDAKAGISAWRWAEAYAGVSFFPFVMRHNPQENYSFIPVYGGIKVNVCPDWIVFPSFFAELGAASAAAHSQYPAAYGPNVMMVDVDNAWRASYYNFGLAVNWNFEDIAVLSLRVERPSFSNISLKMNSDSNFSVRDTVQGEIQVLKIGLAWQIYY